MGFKFEKLAVWKKSVELGFHVHELTRTFPKEELYILTSQIKRAADSIALNIAGSAPEGRVQLVRRMPNSNYFLDMPLDRRLRLYPVFILAKEGN